jgi:hypothetical protein
MKQPGDIINDIKGKAGQIVVDTAKGGGTIGDALTNIVEKSWQVTPVAVGDGVRA